MESYQYVLYCSSFFNEQYCLVIFFHIITYRYPLAFETVPLYFKLWMNCNLCNQSSTDGYLEFSQWFPITNNTENKTLLHISLWTCISVLENDYVDLEMFVPNAMCILNFYRCLQVSCKMICQLFSFFSIWLVNTAYLLV